MAPLSPPVLLPVVSVERRENSARRLREEFERGVGYNNNNDDDLIDYVFSNWIRQEHEGGDGDGWQEDEGGDSDGGLSEETIGRCLKKRKPCPDQDRELDHHHRHHDTGNKVCAVCLEDLVGESSSDIKEVDEDMFVGVLDCRHEFHVRCIKQWLRRKNACPLCRATALGRCE